MERQVITWTMLCQRTKHLMNHDRVEYEKLKGTAGTSRLLGGYLVRHRYATEYEIYRSGGEARGPALAEVRGLWTKEGYFTVLAVPLTPTKYRKRFWDKHMPVSFPAGVPKRGAQPLPAEYHAPNGSTHIGKVSMSMWRNDPASFDLCCGSAGCFVLNDTTGKIVHFSSPEGIEDVRESTDAIEVYRYCRGDRDTWRSFPAWRFALSEDLLGHEGAVASRNEWLQTIYDAAKEGLLNTEKCLLMAVRMWNAAYEFCQENKYRDATFHAIPMRKADRRVPVKGWEPIVPLRWSDPEIAVVDGVDERVPSVVSSVESYRMPQVVIEFRGANLNAPRTHPFHNGPSYQDTRSIVMTLPPHGNELLKSKPHYGSPDGRTFLCKSNTRSEKEWDESTNDYTSIYDRPHLVVRGMERAYHNIPILIPGKARSGGNMNLGPSRMYTLGRSWADHDGDAEGSCAKWEDYPDCVHVTSNFDESISGADGPWAVNTGSCIGYPATPEAATGMVAEALLLASMPLS